VSMNTPGFCRARLCECAPGSLACMPPLSKPAGRLHCSRLNFVICCADEMGMGKTIQAISLIMTHRTDDPSKLPPIISAEAAAGNVGVSARAVVRKVLDPSRPKLRLGGAPPRQEEQGGSSAAQAEAASAAEAAAVRPAEAAQPQDAPADGRSPGVLPDLLVRQHAVYFWFTPICYSRDILVCAGCCCDGEHAGGDAQPAASSEARPFFGDPYGGYSKATLVICPLVAVIQWGQEIARFTAPGTLKVRQQHVWCCASAWLTCHCLSEPHVVGVWQ
jgi:hypothetical protein